jgi:flavin-binding protein dodecin
VAAAVTGSEPTIMLTGPAPAARKALQKAGLSINDIDLFEVNEAFASVVLRFMRELDVPHDKVNVNGGAIALGHPLGATGCMLLGTLLDELEARSLRRGMVAMCVGGGMGIATIIERAEHDHHAADGANVSAAGGAQHQSAEPPIPARTGGAAGPAGSRRPNLARSSSASTPNRPATITNWST